MQDQPVKFVHEEQEKEKVHTEQLREKTPFQAQLTDTKRSAIQKYQDVVVGSRSWWQLIKYEFIVMFIAPLPGAFGALLRKLFYPMIFGSIGRGVVFGKGMTIRHPHKIHIGSHVIIDDGAVLDAKGADKGIFIGDHVVIGRNTVLSTKEIDGSHGNIRIGANTNIAMHCLIQAAADVTIGQNVLFAAYCYVIGGGNHETDRTDIPIIAQGQTIRGVTIDDNCWLGAKANIMDGVHIGRDSIIGAGATVTKDVPEFVIAVGVPAKVLKARK